jgi:hypothetical protein
MASQQVSRDTPAHTPGTGKGEEKAVSSREQGRHDIGTTHRDRPASGSTARDATGINPENEEPIDPRMPHFIPA